MSAYCRWIISKGKECGQSGTHMHPGTARCYCDEHAASLRNFMDLHPLAAERPSAIVLRGDDVIRDRVRMSAERHGIVGVHN